MVLVELANQNSASSLREFERELEIFILELIWIFNLMLTWIANQISATHQPIVTRIKNLLTGEKINDRNYCIIINKLSKMTNWTNWVPESRLWGNFKIACQLPVMLNYIYGRK